jgi:hypothetical protein
MRSEGEPARRLFRRRGVSDHVQPGALWIGDHGEAADTRDVRRSVQHLAAERGLVEYCQPRSGYRVGLSGGSYANVCPAATEAGFVNGFRWGRQIHDAHADLRSTQARLRSARDGLAQTDKAIAGATAELLLSNLPKDRRLFLAQELVRLGQERTELAMRIDELTVRAQQLAISVQQLERQSPYAL